MVRSIVILSVIATISAAQECVGDTFLPIFPGETEYSAGLRGVFYFIGMVWMFLGIAIAADKFMEAISVITAKTKTIFIGGEECEVLIWNETVANLTLMALGSSAPEILLATIETIALGFEAGELGPGTIVGSAAFNLLVITAICVVGIPKRDEANPEEEPGHRRIKELGVFAITAACSIFAYIWMFLVISVSSPDEVELWEAILTLFFFPVLVILAYMADKKYFNKCGGKSEGPTTDPDHETVQHIVGLHKGHENDAEQELLDAMRVKDGTLEVQDVEKLAHLHALNNVKHTRLHYRLHANQKVTGGKKLLVSKTHQEDVREKITIGFSASHYSVMENGGHITVYVERKGAIEQNMTIKYATENGTAISGDEYTGVSGTLQFTNSVKVLPIKIEIIDNDEPNPDRIFKVNLSDPQFTSGNTEGYQLAVKIASTEVTIIDDDLPGVFQFIQPTFAATPQEPGVTVTVKRSNGCSGHIDIPYFTSDGSAVKDTDYEETKGVLNFEPGETEKEFQIPIKPDARFDDDLTFTVEIGESKTYGVKIGKLSKATITLTNDEDFKKLVDKFAEMMRESEEKLQIGTSSWREQFKAAMSMPEPEEEGEEHSASDYILHVLSFYWKVIMATVPPTSIWNGWATFIVSLAFTGIITALVGDLAGMFGCVIGLSKPVTAITFIALGTSVPDTFASKLAATQDPYADAAIGNVTGSNSVNVFLGLGLPWLLATLYHTSNGTVYEVPSGTLGFSVGIFTLCAVICIGLLIIKRRTQHCELGGTGFWRNGLGWTLVSLWFLYVLLSALNDYGHF